MGAGARPGAGPPTRAEPGGVRCRSSSRDARPPRSRCPTRTARPAGLRDYAGRPLILYFYPKDDTPGCTREACAFRDALPRFKKGRAAVLGVSVLDTASKARFARKHELNFPLLADPEHTVADRYGAWQKKSLYGRDVHGRGPDDLSHRTGRQGRAAAGTTSRSIATRPTSCRPSTRSEGRRSCPSSSERTRMPPPRWRPWPTREASGPPRSCRATRSMTRPVSGCARPRSSASPRSTAATWTRRGGSRPRSPRPRAGSRPIPAARPRAGARPATWSAGASSASAPARSPPTGRSPGSTERSSTSPRSTCSARAGSTRPAAICSIAG